MPSLVAGPAWAINLSQARKLRHNDEEGICSTRYHHFGVGMIMARTVWLALFCAGCLDFSDMMAKDASIAVEDMGADQDASAQVPDARGDALVQDAGECTSVVSTCTYAPGVRGRCVLGLGGLRCVICGQPGLVCCANAPACGGRSCCTSENVPSLGVPFCVAEGAPSPVPVTPTEICAVKQGMSPPELKMMACGHQDHPCCPGAKCSDGCCIANRCVKTNDSCYNTDAGMKCDDEGVCKIPGSMKCGGTPDAALMDCCPADRGTHSGSIPFCSATYAICRKQEGDDVNKCAGSCGNPGEPCCEGNVCLRGGCCVGGRCVAMGGAIPDGGGLVCTLGDCTGSDEFGGAAGFPPCAGGCTAPFTELPDASVCASCGGLGQLCCSTAAQAEPGHGYCAYPYTCTIDPTTTGSMGMCKQCGRSNEPCCPGSRCESGACNETTDLCP